jgi:hypothetical protein
MVTMFSVCTCMNVISYIRKSKSRNPHYYRKQLYLDLNLLVYTPRVMVFMVQSQRYTQLHIMFVQLMNHH